MPRSRHTGPLMTDGLHLLRTHRRRRRVAPLARAQGALALIAKRTSAKMIAAGLTVPERLMLFCVASATDWGPQKFE